MIQRNITFDKLQPEELKFRVNRGGRGGAPHRMEKESHMLDLEDFSGKVHNLEARKLMKSQNELVSSMVGRSEKTMIKIEYFDTLLNLERKMEHFIKLFTKIKLRVIHKPFIILDMMKIMTDGRSGVNLLASLLGKLVKMRKREAVDSVIDFVEHKKELITKWGRLVKGKVAGKKREDFMEIESRQIEKQKEQRKMQKNRRGLRYLGTILNNFFREYKRNVWASFARKVFAEDSKWENREVSLDITNQQGFLKAKEKKAALGSSERGFPKGKDENEESSFNHTFEVRRNQMNAYFYKNGKAKGSVYNSGDEDKGKKKREFESSFEDPEEGGLQRVQMALESKQVDSGKLLGQIRSEIEKIQEKLNKDETKEEQLSVKEKIDMLGQLTNLMQLIKKYYEGFKDKEHTKKGEREDFEQVLMILQRVVASLLHRLPSEVGALHPDKSRRSSHLNEEEASVDEEQIDYESAQAQLDDVNKHLTKEMEGLLNLIEPKVGIQRKTRNENYESEKRPFETEEERQADAEQFQSVSGINGLLQEMMQNLNVMNENIEGAKGRLHQKCKFTRETGPLHSKQMKADSPTQIRM